MLAVELIDELVDGVFRASLPLIRDELGLTFVQIGMLVGIPALVSNVLEPFIVLGADVWHRRAVIIGGGIAFAVALGLIAGAPSFAVLLAAMILFFPASGSFVSVSQATLMDADPSRREQNMARWTAAGYVGNVVGPFIVAASVALAFTWRGAYALLAVLALLALPGMFRFPIVRNGPRPQSLLVAIRDALGHLRRGEVIRWLVLLEAADLMLDVLTAFVTLYLVEVGAITPAQGALVVGAYSAAGLVGELGVVVLLERVPGLAYLRRSALLVTLTYPVLLVVTPGWAKVAVVVGLGALTAGWYSILQAQLYTSLPDRSGTALALKNVTGIVASLVPVGLGAVAEAYGITTMMWLLWIGPLALVVGLGGVRKSDVESRTPRSQGR